MQLLETVCVDWPYWPRGAISNAKAVLNVDAMREKNMEVADLSTPDKKQEKVGHVLPGVVVCLLLSIMVGRVKKGATVIGASCCGALPA